MFSSRDELSFLKCQCKHTVLLFKVKFDLECLFRTMSRKENSVVVNSETGKEWYVFGDSGTTTDEKGRIYHNTVERKTRTRVLVKFRIGEIARMKGSNGTDFVGQILAMYEGLPRGPPEERVQEHGCWVDLRWLYTWPELNTLGQKKAGQFFSDDIENDLYWSDHVDLGLNPIEVLGDKVNVYQGDEEFKNLERIRMYYDRDNFSMRRLKSRELRFLLNKPSGLRYYDSPMGVNRSIEQRSVRKSAGTTSRPRRPKTNIRKVEYSEDEFTEQEKDDTKKRHVPREIIKKTAGYIPSASMQSDLKRSDQAPNRNDDDEVPLALKKQKLNSGRSKVRSAEAARKVEAVRKSPKFVPGQFFTQEEMRELAEETARQRATLNSRELELTHQCLGQIQKKLKQEFLVAKANGIVTDTKWITSQLQRMMRLNVAKT